MTEKKSEKKIPDFIVKNRARIEKIRQENKIMHEEKIIQEEKIESMNINVNNASRNETISLNELSGGVDGDLDDLFLEAGGNPDEIKNKSRTIQRKFNTILDAAGFDRKLIQPNKDAKIRIDVNDQAAISALLIESMKKESYLSKSLKKDFGDISFDDVLEHFHSIKGYLDKKVDQEEDNDRKEELRGMNNAFLIQQDMATDYSLIAILYNIQVTLISILDTIQFYDYPVQVQIMHELQEELFKNYVGKITNEIVDSIVDVKMHQELLDEFEGEDDGDDDEQLDSMLNDFEINREKKIKEFLSKNEGLQEIINEKIKNYFENN